MQDKNSFEKKNENHRNQNKNRPKIVTIVQRNQPKTPIGAIRPHASTARSTKAKSNSESPTPLAQLSR